MAVNPMQRKANNSFLLGVLITLLIAGVIIALLFVQISKLNKEKKEADAKKVYAYVIKQEVKSGNEIKASDVMGIEMRMDYTSSIIYSSKAKDKDGKDTIDATGNLLPSGLKAKVDLHPGTVVTSDLIYEDEQLAADVRKQEYNIIVLPSQLESGEYVDIRLRLPNGQDFIVVSHKQVTLPQINGVESNNCIWINMDEVEILNMSGAIVEAYRMNGAKLYATKYIEAGIQQAATVTYLPSNEILDLINKDPNAVQEAKNELFKRNNDSAYKSTVRNPINSAKGTEGADDRLQSSVQSEISGLQEERQKYLESLGG